MFSVTVDRTYLRGKLVWDGTKICGKPGDGAMCAEATAIGLRTKNMSKITPTTKGVFVIAATPFEPNGVIDSNSLDGMVDFYFDKGADGLTILA